MARIIIKCRYTGHYVFTGIDTEKAPLIRSGRVSCPYCVAEHVWTADDAHLDESKKNAMKPIVRQAS